MTLAYIVIGVAVALVVLTLLWGVRHPSEEREPREPSKRYGGFRRVTDESDSV
jgi:multisubunit Na+/H+ antiporter MnhC subunit